MKMQLREILKPSAVDDQPVGLEIEFPDKALNGREQIGKKGGVVGIEFREGFYPPLGDDQHVKRIGGGRMMKRKQVRGLAEAPDREEETHAGEDPTDEGGEGPEQSFNQRIRFYRHPWT